VSFLDSKGRPSVTERAYVLPPGSQIGPITPQQRQALMQSSLVAGVYEKAIDSESAYEMLKARTETALAETAKAAEASGGLMGGISDVLFGSKGPRGGARDGLVQQVLKSEARNLARQVLRGALGSILGSKKR
jgi:DNA helicase HerA-like ATPase